MLAFVLLFVLCVVRDTENHNFKSQCVCVCMFVMKSQLYFTQANVDMHHYANKPLFVFEGALLEVEFWKMRVMGIPPQKKWF